MGRPRQHDEGQIIARAMEAFWAQGVRGTSIRDLERATGATAPALYLRFGHKAALFDRALDLYLDRMRERLDLLTHGETGLEAIVLFFQSLIDDADASARGCLLINAIAELGCMPERSDRYARGLDAIRNALDAAVLRGQHDDSISRAVSTDSLGRALHGAVIALRVQAKSGASPSQLQFLVDAHIEIITNRKEK